MKGLNYQNAILFAFSILVSVLILEVFLNQNDRSSHGGKYSEYRMNGRKYLLWERPETLSGSGSAIVFVGDSFTAGSKCGFDANLPGQFQKSVGPGRRVINLGFPGTGPFSYATRIADYSKEYGKPEFVFVILYSNDIVMESAMCSYLPGLAESGRFRPEEVASLKSFCKTVNSREPGAPPPEQTRAGGAINDILYEHSYAYRFFREVGAQVLAFMPRGDGIGRQTYPPAWDDANGTLFRLVEFALEKLKQQVGDTPVLVGFYPNVENLSPSNPLVEPYRKAAKLLHEALKIPVYSGFDAYLSNPEAKRNMTWSLTDAHPSCEAHSIFARWLLERTRDAYGPVF